MEKESNTLEPLQETVVRNEGHAIQMFEAQGGQLQREWQVGCHPLSGDDVRQQQRKHLFSERHCFEDIYCCCKLRSLALKEGLRVFHEAYIFFVKINFTPLLEDIVKLFKFSFKSHSSLVLVGRIWWKIELISCFNVLCSLLIMFWYFKLVTLSTWNAWRFLRRIWFWWILAWKVQTLPDRIPWGLATNLCIITTRPT